MNVDTYAVKPGVVAGAPVQWSWFDIHQPLEQLNIKCFSLEAEKVLMLRICRRLFINQGEDIMAGIQLADNGCCYNAVAVWRLELHNLDESLAVTSTDGNEITFVIGSLPAVAPNAENFTARATFATQVSKVKVSFRCFRGGDLQGTGCCKDVAL